MEKIVFINQWASYLIKDIINVFSERYNNVALITGHISESGCPLSNNVKVSKILSYNRKNIITRSLTWLLATIQIVFLVKTKYRGYHMFLTSNPPTSAFVPIFCNNTYSVQILDVYPDIIYAGNIIKKESFIIKLWERRNIKYFKNAKQIFTITDGMAATLSKYCERQKIKVIYQWPAFKDIELINKKDNIFINTHHLFDKFIVMYAGNIGLGHHVTSLVETANILRNREDIVFIIIGEGWNKPVIENLIKKYRLINCLLLPFQTVEMFKHVLQATDIGVVSVSKEMAALSVPIKTYNLIKNQIPLLAITEGDSELERLIAKYRIGECFTPVQGKEISDYILFIKSNREVFDNYKKNLCKINDLFSYKNAVNYLIN